MAVATRVNPESLVFRGSRPELVACEVPAALTPGLVRIRPTHLIMGSLERRILRGEIAYAGVLGREGAWIVEAAGDGVSPALIGKRVVVEAFRACMQCELCRGGIRHLCVHRTSPGLAGADGLASRWSVVPASSLVEVPAAIKSEVAALAQSVAAALHAVRTAAVDARGYITILGDGPMAMLTARIASGLNGQVRLLGKHPDRFMLCERIGLKHRHIAEAGKRHDQQVVIDCTGDGSVDGFTLAAALAAPRARIVVKAPPVAIPCRDAQASPGALSQIAALEATVIGAGAGQLREGVNWLLKNPLDEGLVVSRRVPWTRAIEALDSLHDRRVLLSMIEVSQDGRG